MSTGTVSEQIRLDLPQSDIGSTSHSSGGRGLMLPKTVVALLFYSLGWVVVFWAAIALPSLEDICCFGVLSDKHRILETAPSPKVVLTGGSNLLFGVDGERLGRALNRKVANMGLCLMFPISYMFEEIKDQIKPGDLVVMSPEFSLLSRQFERPMVMADILDGYPRAIEWILRTNCSWEDKGKILFHLRTLGLQKITYAAKHVRQIVQKRCKWSFGKPNPGAAVINSQNLDSCGDLMWHLNQKVGPDSMERKIRMQVPYHMDDATVAQINGFADFCRARGAYFVLIPPSVPTLMYGKSKMEVDALMAEANQRLTPPILTSVQRYAFPDEQIYGGHYHLDKVGREVRTDRMIEDLRGALAHFGESAR